MSQLEQEWPEEDRYPDVSGGGVPYPAGCGWCRDPGCDGDHSGDREFLAEQSTTACCPRQTIPDSCSCLENCTCTCRDCGCGAWWDADERGDDDE